MLSVVLLHWKRPRNIERIIAHLLDDPFVNEILVWDNSPGPALNLPPTVSGIKTNRDLGLNTRFAAAGLCRNECVLIQDDDLILPHSTLATLYNAWSADSAILHGIFGRAPKPDGGYGRNLNVRLRRQGHASMPAPIILTRALLTRRSYAGAYLSILDQPIPWLSPDRPSLRFQDLLSQGQPAGNGEDILFSYVARSFARRLHCLHNLPVHELPQGSEAICKRWEQHWTHRSQVLRACQHWLEACTTS